MNDKKETLVGWYDLECDLYSDTKVSIERRIFMAYGALNAMKVAGLIDWDKMHEMFGKFVADIYNITLRK